MKKTIISVLILTIIATANIFTITDKNENVFRGEKINGTNTESNVTEYSLQAFYDELHSKKIVKKSTKTLNDRQKKFTKLERVKKIETSERKFGFYYNDAGKKIIIKSMDNIKYICGESSGGANPAWYYVDSIGQYREVHKK